VKKVKKGLQAQITATGVQGTIYGTVSSVGLVAQANDSGAAVFPVTIDVTGQRSDLYAGVSSTVSIIVQQKSNVLTVASRALSTSNGKTYVTKVVAGKKVKTAVQVGETYGLTTEVVSGLKAGDQVVVPGFAGPGGSTRTGTGRSGTGGGEFPNFGGGNGGGFPAGGRGE
jgi:macrolide-specific efflux system membrane fusion protein